MIGWDIKTREGRNVQPANVHSPFNSLTMINSSLSLRRSVSRRDEREGVLGRVEASLKEAPGFLWDAKWRGNPCRMHGAKKWIRNVVGVCVFRVLIGPASCSARL